MISTEQYQKIFEDYLSEKIEAKDPKNLYEPMAYILKLGGKRVRPVLVLMAADIFGDNSKEALDAALAIEVFHNFSLVHDDIMDNAPLRRGQKTVHELWDVNTAILSGDAMLIRAYQLFENYRGEVFRELAQLFSATAIEVCEGQQYDIDFESQEKVEIEQYIKMIEQKTAILVGASLKMGAIVAGASGEDKTAVYQYGKLLGTAFQLQDDYLDVFGEPALFGKKQGGDIIENKKTFLYLTAVLQADQSEASQLEHLYSINPKDGDSKIEAVKSLFRTSGAAQRTQEEINRYTGMAFEVLENMKISEDKKLYLRQFGENLMNRFK